MNFMNSYKEIDYKKKDTIVSDICLHPGNFFS